MRKYFTENFGWEFADVVDRWHFETKRMSLVVGKGRLSFIGVRRKQPYVFAKMFSHHKWVTITPAQAPAGENTAPSSAETLEVEGLEPIG